MRYYIHIVTDQERVRDHDGHDFADLEKARLEAEQSARDLMAEELRQARPLPLAWRVQLADNADAILWTASFAELVFGAGAAIQIVPVSHPLSPEMHVALIERAKVTFGRARASHSEIRQGLAQLRANVRMLAQFTSALGEVRG